MSGKNISIGKTMILAVVLFASTAFGQSYTILDLGTLGSPPTPLYQHSEATGLNSLGQVVGWSTSTTIYGYVGFRTAPNTPLAFGDIVGYSTSSIHALGINDSGQAVGVKFTQGPHRAWRIGPNEMLNAVSDLGSGQAAAINASGQTVGSTFAFAANSRAFRTSANGPMDASTNLGGFVVGGASYALGINDAGQVVGAAYFAGNTVRHSFRTTAAGIIDATTDIGTLGGLNSGAGGINASGRVVGVSDILGVQHAYRTAANSPINPLTDDLGTLGGDNSTASDIDVNGVVVGQAQVQGGAYHAFVFDGTMHDLNDLVGGGWVLTNATGINDSGQICGSGIIGGETHAFLVTPVPEPSSIVLVVGGLLVCGRRRGRRKG